MGKRFNLNLKKNFGSGVFILVLIGIALWFFDTFLAGVDGIIRAGLLHLIPTLRPYLENTNGVGLLVAFLFAPLLGALASIKLIRSIIRFLLMRIPLVGRLIGSVLDTLTGLSSLPLVEVTYPSSGHYAKGWLRSVRWAEKPTADGGKERFIECTVAIPTMNNPTSGWGIVVEPAEIRYVLSNPSTDFVWHILSFTLSNPKWERDRVFDPDEFLDEELVSQDLQEHLLSRIRPQERD